MLTNYTYHRNILLRILKDIYQDPSLGAILGFKGGTAAMMFYDLPRYSVDLDFDLTDLSHQASIIPKIRTLLSHYGRITDEQSKKYTLLFVLSYAPQSPKIKIEISLRDFGSRYEIKNLYGISMKVMVQADMFAHKLMALYERIGQTSRDIFDVHYFAKNNWPMNENIVTARSQMSFRETLKSCITKLENLDQKHILDGLRELLTESQKDTTRATLRENTLFFLRAMADDARGT